ncbi:peptidoglycan-binding protein [Paractinoplanes deccanensis]|uniref:Peptidoglycan-binding protein n=1 Tax=Paractinoplanes deccanensis TaxID=113561 RepID=A0ABQ3YJC3_9ACTN|nr:efflux RND transporter periplasmic adaptor subunit [Actinoplanes deccanensis]GID80108.1 peptidoglycan-binding protein [Actinoplanes deccanensis]
MQSKIVARLSGIVLVVALGAGGAVAVHRHRPAGPPAPRETVAAATAKLERRTLSTTRKLDGSVGFGSARPLSGHTAATVTWLPAAGATIVRGKQLFRADDKPVILFYGGMPLYRPIAGLGLVGRDVRIVADNLRALGYRIGRRPEAGEKAPAPAGKKGATVRDGDGVLTADLLKAVKRWQEDNGLPPTGTIAVGDVEVQSGAVRVDSVAVQPGSPANTELMTVTATRKVITVSAELDAAAGLSRGEHVTVTLPDDRTVKARILSVGRTLTAPAGGVADGAPKLTVLVTADKPADLAELDSAGVQVNVAGKVAENVLAAPVEALVALSEGGYAVQGPHGLVAVTTGMFADGWVQVSGQGLTEGMDVVVAS